jgi:hypothetical protein
LLIAAVERYGFSIHVDREAPMRLPLVLSLAFGLCGLIVASHSVAESPARDTGPASMNVRALVAGQAVPAHVRVLDGSGKVLTEAESGTVISLSAGKHRIELQISDAASLADTPTQAREVFLEAGKTTQVDATFPWAKVQLNVLVAGRSQGGVPVKLIRNGQVVAQMKAGAKPAAISPGRYEADVLLRGTTIRVKGLMFPEGATQTVPVRVQF